MPDDIRDPAHGFPKDGRLASERELLATDQRLRKTGGVDRRDHAQQLRAVSDKASASLKVPLRPNYPSLAGVVRVIGDK